MYGWRLPTDSSLELDQARAKEDVLVKLQRAMSGWIDRLQKLKSLIVSSMLHNLDTAVGLERCDCTGDKLTLKADRHTARILSSIRQLCW